MRHCFLSIGLVALGVALAGGCASLDSKTQAKAEQDQKLERFAQRIRQSFDLGKTLSSQYPTLVEDQGDLVLSQTLQTFYAPYAGAQRLMAFAKRNPDHPLLPVYLEKDLNGRYFDFQDEEDFKNGLFFGNFEDTLFDPFYRQALLTYVSKKEFSEQEFLGLALALKEAGRLTPRYADFFPNDLAPETRKSFESYLTAHPQGPLSDRFSFFLLAQDRCGAWNRERKNLDTRLASLQDSTTDDLLKLEIQSTLDQPYLDPGKAFLFSAVVPGSGQVLNGDLMGGVFVAGLAGAAWWWTLSRLVGGLQARDVHDRQIAFGDVAWRAPLVVLFHGFAAVNASSQARFVNITLQWDLLNEPRLKETFKGRH